MKRSEHPFTAAILSRTDDLRGKIMVETPRGRLYWRKPKWIAKWEGWFARIGCGWLTITAVETSASGRVKLRVDVE